MELFEKIKESIKRSQVTYNKHRDFSSRNNSKRIVSSLVPKKRKWFIFNWTFLKRRIYVVSDDGRYVDIEELTDKQCEEIHNAMIERYVELQEKSKKRNLRKYLN